jgi:hypothetical protein
MMIRNNSVASLVAIVILISNSPANADSYEDNCLLAVSQTLPAATTVQKASVQTASPELISSLGRVRTMRWVHVSMTLSLGGLRIAKDFICGQNAAGERIVVPTDRSGPDLGGGYTVR